MRCGRTPARESRGFTLIEVLLATVLLAAGLGIAFATLTAANRTVQRRDAKASLPAQSLLETEGHHVQPIPWQRHGEGGRGGVANDETFAIRGDPVAVGRLHP